ncbi:hypothetical protein ACWOFR_17105 [Carnobacterium gallinarum]|uniref:hypothetical protein n=1 Tax=Carnobacterium gallinarum TaxID=2749 RepID=UPI0005500E41|nr:hypothetical protein [Carnobacterium gallinarum]
MATEYIYVYLDSVTNHVLSKGMDMDNFQYSLKQTPKNILLLDAKKGVGEFESHTGFRIIRGRENVHRHFDECSKSPEKMSKWIDFESLELLRQLTPVEISELLYIAHAHTHLHSPFYYKLQNNFIYLTLPDAMTKVYYRYLDQYFTLLSLSLTNALTVKINEKRSFFQKPQEIKTIPIEMVKQLIPYLKEGALFSLKQLEVHGDSYDIPIFLAEDRLREVGNPFPEQDRLATICYNRGSGVWSIHETETLLARI